MSFLPEAGQLTLEFSRKLVDKYFVPEENIFQPLQYTLF